MSDIIPHKIVLSRTDSIGDVVLTLPMAGLLKAKYPEAIIVFLGNTYTKPIISCSEHVDEIWEWAELEKLSPEDQLSWMIEQNVDTFIHVFPRKELAQLAKKAKIKNRIGTSHRSFHLLTCSHKVNFTRKGSELHESQLNLKLLSPFGIIEEPSLDELSSYLGFSKILDLPSQFKELLDDSKEAVILHPKSQGSAIEWGVDNFIQLAKELDANRYQIFITGTEQEAESFRDLLPIQENIIDMSGKLTLSELVSFISHCNHLVAASTGPLHIAGVCGIHAIGLFSEQRPIHSGRWKPLGNRVTILGAEKNPNPTQPLSIEVRDVKKAVEKLL